MSITYPPELLPAASLDDDAEVLIEDVVTKRLVRVPNRHDGRPSPRLPPADKAGLVVRGVE